MRRLAITGYLVFGVLLASGAVGCKKSRRSTGNVDEARPIVEAFVKTGADRPALFAALHPRESDYAVVFSGDAAQRAKDALEPLWDSSKGIEPGPEQTEVEVFSATPDELSKGEGGAPDFPGAYKAVADKFNPTITLFCFKFSKKGDQGGLVGDALIKVDDHWAYFPKVFRYLK